MLTGVTKLKPVNSSFDRSETNALALLQPGNHNGGDGRFATVCLLSASNDKQTVFELRGENEGDRQGEKAKPKLNNISTLADVHGC